MQNSLSHAFSWGKMPQIILKQKEMKDIWQWQYGRTWMNIALFSPVMKLNTRNPRWQDNLDAGVHGLLPHQLPWETVSQKEQTSLFFHWHKGGRHFSDTEKNKTKIPSRRCSDERYYDTCKSNAFYEQWYWRWEKRKQKPRRNQDTGEVSPTILYVILFTHPPYEQKSHHDLCRERQVASLRKQNGLLIEEDEKFAFCKKQSL